MAHKKQSERLAFSYIRFSSGKQRDGDSLRRQTDGRADEYCKLHGLTLSPATYHDLSVSAWRGDNADTGALGAFLNAVNKKSIPPGSVLIVEHLDRLTRQHIRKALALFLQILDAGITIVTLEPEREYRPDADSDPLTLIEPILLFANANEKSETLSKRLRAAWAAKRERKEPLTSICPEWMELRDGEYHLIPERAEIVRTMVQLSINGYGDSMLIRKLHADGTPPFTSHPHWSRSYLAKILRNPALYGAFEPGTFQRHPKTGKKSRRKTGEVWEDYFPAVITKDEWLQLRAVRQKRKTADRGRKGTLVSNLFSGLVYNARDGSTMFRIVKNIPRLISSAARDGLDGDSQSFPYVPFEIVLLRELVSKLRIADLYSDNHETEPDPTDMLMARIADIDIRLETIKKRIATDAEFDSLIDVLASLDAERIKLQQELDAARQQTVATGGTLEDLQALDRLLQDDTGNIDIRLRLRATIKSLISEIWVVICGQKRSKWKTLYGQIFFHDGGSALLSLTCTKDVPTAVSFITKSSTGKAVLDNMDFRQLSESENVQHFVEILDRIHYDAIENLRTNGEAAHFWNTYDLTAE